jgi:hypothetical protein
MAIYFSAKSGDWNTTTTWLTAAVGVYNVSSALPAGQPPQSFGGDKIVIRPGHTVNYNVQGCFGDETSNYFAGAANTYTAAQYLTNAIVLSGGTLKAARTGNIELTARGTIYIAASGTLDWGTTDDPIQGNANIILHYMAPYGTPTGSLSASQGAAGLYLQGPAADNIPLYNNIYLNGKPKTRNTILTSPGSAGATVINVANATNWEIGDKLVIATESITNISSSTVGVLSSTYIQNVNGNTITISPGLNNSRSVSACVSNFTSNVNIKSYNPLYPSYGVLVYGSLSNVIDINHVKFESVGWGITAPFGWMPYSYTGSRALAAQTGAPLGGLSIYMPYSQTPGFTVKGVVMETLANGGQHYGFYVNGKWSEVLTIEDYTCHLQQSNGYGIYTNSQTLVNIKNSNILRSTYGIFLGTSVPNSVVVDNCNIDSSAPLGPSINGFGLNVTNSKLRGLSYISPLDSILNAKIKNSKIYHNSSTGAIFQNNVNSSGSVNFSNCNFYYGTTPLSTITKTSVGMNNKTAQSAEFTIFQANGNLTDYRRFNYYHYSQSDLTMRKRGITSYRIKPEVANKIFYNYFTIPGIIDTTQRIKGSLRFDSNYGTTYPPSISFIGAGVDMVCACAATPNVWQDFDITFKPTTTDDITISVACQSTGTNGYVWLDGISLYPYIQQVRHYGFQFDNNPYRTKDPYTTYSEADVSNLSSVTDLNQLYDVSVYWSVTNIVNNNYLDLVTPFGSVLDFNNYNVVINSSSGSVLDYNTGSITIKSSNLTSSNQFSEIKTNGTVTINNGSVVDNTVIIRSSNYDSELVYAGADSITLYPTYQDAIDNTNPGPISNTGVLRFLYGQTLNGVQMSGGFYIKWLAGGYTDIYSGAIDQSGTITLGDLSAQAGLAIAVNNLKIINTGIQKTSILVPHSTEIGYKDGLSSQIQTILDEQVVLNDGVKKASRLIPHTTNL